MTREEAGKKRVEAALDAIEDARAAIATATWALSGVNGTVPEWARLNRLYDEVKATASALRDRSGQLGRLGGPTLAWEPDDEFEPIGPVS